MNMWTRGLVHKCKVPVSGFVHSHSELQLPPWFRHTNQVTAPELLSIFLTFWPSWPFEYKCHHFIIVILWDIWVKYCCFMNSWVMFKSVLYQVTMTFDLWPLIFYHLIFKSKWTVCQAKKLRFSKNWIHKNGMDRWTTHKHNASGQGYHLNQKKKCLDIYIVRNLKKKKTKVIR